MLYPKNQTSELSKELFQNPTCEYRGTPFWAWNCELDKDDLLWQLEVMKKMGLGGAHMHVRTGLATKYLSDEHMDMIKACVEKCRKEEMLAWLYDEDRWPSGAAGGLVTKDPQYRSRFLLFTADPVLELEPTAVKKADKAMLLGNGHSNAGATRSGDGYLLACFDVQLDKAGSLVSYRKIDASENAVGKKWYIYVMTPKESSWYNGQTYVDTLNKAAIKRFIDITYERYKETVGKDFGGVVPAMFTDEPQFSRKQTLAFAHENKDVILPWTDDVPETYRARYGCEIVEQLPELIWDLAEGAISTCRYHYHDHICDRFVEAFVDQCGNWCADNGLMLTGHMMQEPTLDSQTCSLGEAIRCYRNFHLPGIDMLCNRIELTTAKQAQSAVHQYGREGMMSELYGVTGWDFDFRGHKFQGDWQAALGVTIRVHHLSWVSMKGEAKRDYPASIHYQSPWWQDYACVEDHFARVNTALTRGKPMIRVGVIHPVESYWLHFGPGQQTEDVRKQLDRSFQNVTKWLLEGNIDFDYISESLLPEQCVCGGNPLSVGKMAYDAIVVPGCETLRNSTLERLEAFQKAGGRLVFLGDAPKYENAVVSQRGGALWASSIHADMTQQGVLTALEPVRIVDIRSENGGRTQNLIHQLRQDGDDRWLFVAHDQLPYENDAPESEKIRVAMDGTWFVTLYDTQSGKLYRVDARHEDGKTVFERTIYDLDSLLLRYTPAPIEAEDEPMFAKTGKRLPTHKLVSYSLDEPNVYLLDKAEYAVDNGEWNPEQELLDADNDMRLSLGWDIRTTHVVQPWAINEPVPQHKAHLRFKVICDRDFENIKMAMEDAELADVCLNGESVKVAVDGWFTDKAIHTFPIGGLKEGENTIEVTIPFGKRTNTEWCYLLGNFGVRVYGEHRYITAPEKKLGFDSIVHQGLAHYGGNVTYEVPIVTRGGDLRVTVPHYTGTGVRVELDGKKQYILYSPYTTVVQNVTPGEHIVKFTLLGNRFNCFGPVHLADPKYRWLGNVSWRTLGDRWTDSYRLKPIGIRSAPIIEELSEE